MKNLLVTVSGGRSSAHMARHVQTYPKYADYNKAFVFCNTGMERPETIDFLKNIVKYWEIPLTIIEGVYSTEKGVGVSYKVVDFDTMDMQAQTFANLIFLFFSAILGLLLNKVRVLLGILTKREKEFKELQERNKKLEEILDSKK